jgi:hypothetical protein
VATLGRSVRGHRRPTGLRVRCILRAYVDFVAAHREVALRVILVRSGPGAEEFTRSQQAGLAKTAHGGRAGRGEVVRPPAA